MEYRRLGNSGLKVSTICLGAMMFGDRTNEEVAARIAASALDAGVNFIDTADTYAKGGSEKIVEMFYALRLSAHVGLTLDVVEEVVVGQAVARQVDLDALDRVAQLPHLDLAPSDRRFVDFLRSGAVRSHDAADWV